MRIFVVTATAADLPVVQQFMDEIDVTVSAINDVPTDCPWADDLGRTLQQCVAVAAVPFGPKMATVLRAVGTAVRLAKPVIVLIPSGGDRDKLPFSMRGMPVIGLDGERSVIAREVLNTLHGLPTPQARPSGAGTPGRFRSGRLNDAATLPTMLSGTSVLTGDLIRLPKRTQPPDFEAPYQTSLFPDGVVNGLGTLSFTVDDLAHDLFTTGRAPGDRMRYGAASIWEWLHRASLVPAYIRRHYTGQLVRSRLALELDRSELVGLSYALGQAMTSIFCRNELAVTHLMHVDRYASHYAVTFGGTRKRADLFGRAPAGWVVAEAKGRTRSTDEALRRKLREQKRSITTIDGVRPWLALGCVASFPPDEFGMRVDAVDPVKDAAEPYAIPASLDGYMLAYYAPFVLAIDTGEPVIRDDTTIAARFGTFGVTVRMWSEIYVRSMSECSRR